MVACRARFVDRKFRQAALFSRALGASLTGQRPEPEGGGSGYNGSGVQSPKGRMRRGRRGRVPASRVPRLRATQSTPSAVLRPVESLAPTGGGSISRRQPSLLAGRHPAMKFRHPTVSFRYPVMSFTPRRCRWRRCRRRGGAPWPCRSRSAAAARRRRCRAGRPRCWRPSSRRRRRCR